MAIAIAFDQIERIVAIEGAQRQDPEISIVRYAQFVPRKLHRLSYAEPVDHPVAVSIVYFHEMTATGSVSSVLHFGQTIGRLSRS